MTVIVDVLKELLGMFISDAWLSAAVLIVIAVSEGLIDVAKVDPLISGLVLLSGCLIVVVESVRRAALRVRTGD